MVEVPDPLSAKRWKEFDPCIAAGGQGCDPYDPQSFAFDYRLQRPAPNSRGYNARRLGAAYPARGCRLIDALRPRQCQTTRCADG